MHQIPGKGREQTLDWLTEVQPDTEKTTTPVDFLGAACSACIAHHPSVLGVGVGVESETMLQSAVVNFSPEAADWTQTLTMTLVEKQAENPSQPVVYLESGPSEPLTG